MRFIFFYLGFIFFTNTALADDFKTVPLNDAFPYYSDINKNTLSFTVPEGYVKHSQDDLFTTLWATEEDIKKVLASKNTSQTKNGAFTLKFSLNSTYNHRTKKFSGEDDLVSQAKKAGFSDVEYRKIEINKIPMATLTAYSGTRYLYLHYIALHNATLLINYFHPEPHSDMDSEIWLNFINGFDS